jgi:hypothetical protein
MSTVSASCGNSTLILYLHCDHAVHLVLILFLSCAVINHLVGRLWSSSVHIFLHDNYDIEHLETILEVSREHCSWNHLAFGLLALLYSVMSILHSDCAGRVSISPSCTSVNLSFSWRKFGRDSLFILQQLCAHLAVVLSAPSSNHLWHMDPALYCESILHSSVHAVCNFLIVSWARCTCHAIIRILDTQKTRVSLCLCRMSPTKSLFPLRTRQTFVGLKACPAGVLLYIETTCSKRIQTTTWNGPKQRVVIGVVLWSKSQWWSSLRP